MPQLAELLACPRCTAPLEDLSCSACEVEFPVHDGVAWLVADPDATRFEWRNRWQMALTQLEARQRAARAALAAEPVHPATLARLDNLADGYAKQHGALKSLLGSLGLAHPADLTTYQALRTRLPTRMGLTAYDANVFRDWCWGEAENRNALEAVGQGLRGSRCEALLVLGAGAGRLAYDLHRDAALRPSLTVAVDLNPYLTGILKRLAGGERLTLMEFPLAPVSGGRSAIERTLEAPEALGDGFEVVLADVAHPPFRSGTFDAVVTPWLVDVLDAPPEAMVRLINGLLKPGGSWIYHGSLAFDRAAVEENLNLEELVALTEAEGYSISGRSENETPYLHSPDSRHGRLERVLTLSASKTRDSEPPVASVDNLPAWLLSSEVPIPALPAFRNQAMATRIHAFIMSLIDGKRTLADMAELMESERLMGRDDAETAIRGFLVKMHEEAVAGSGF